MTKDPSAATNGADRSTRERILDVALELFIDQGYDKTSLREVAERMGFTKAALYYHFPSKADMLAALHQRMHSLMDEPLALLTEGTVTIASFERFLHVCIEQIQANQKLFVLHRVNQAALSKMHMEGDSAKVHDARHDDMEEVARKVFSDPSFSEEERVRMAAAFSATMLTPMILTGWAPGSDPGVLRDTLKQVAGQILQPAMASKPGPKATRRPAPGKAAAK